MKTAVYFKIQIFESRYQKKYLIRVSRFLAHPPRNESPVYFFLKLNHILMANIFEFHKYQTFGLLKMHNISKI